jgi:hypothetical protein
MLETDVSVADELLKLEQLRNSGSLTPAEFDEAKYQLLHPALTSPAPASPARTSSEPSLGIVVDDRSPFHREAGGAGRLFPAGDFTNRRDDGGIIIGSGPSSTGRSAADRYVDLKEREYNNSKIGAVIGGVIFVIVLIIFIGVVSSMHGDSSQPSFPGGGNNTCTVDGSGQLSC